jgi:hypothetical protein
MARWERPWFAAALAVLALAGVLAVSGFSAERPSASGAAWLSGTVRASAAAGSGGWGKALPVPGAAEFNKGVAAWAEISQVSCSSPGNCGAVGSYSDGSEPTQIFVTSQARGIWGKAAGIPGTTVFARRRHLTSAAIACPAAGGCIAVGSYADAAGHPQAFIASQVRGAWRKLIWVPGLAKLNRGNNAGLSDIWCASAGNCAAIGSYTDAAGNTRSFTVTQVHGTWRTAVPVPGATGLPGQQKGTEAGIGPISCASPGNCSAAGSYPVRGGNQVFVISQTRGGWGRAKPVPGLAALNTGRGDSISAISCASPGNCAAGGVYTFPDGAAEAFVASQTAGTWRTAIEVPGTSALNTQGDAMITTISCPSAGNCTAGGDYNTVSDADNSEVFLVSQVHGTWGKAIEVPGTGRLNKGDDAWLTQVSCSSAGNCGAGGWYSPAYDYGLTYTQPFVINQVHGTWDKATEIPGIGKLNTNTEGGITAISCTATDRCSAGGYYNNLKTGLQPFVDSQP